MNKFKKQEEYKDEYILTLNIFYENYFNKVDNELLLKEYNLLLDVMCDLVYDHIDSWYIKFGNNQYKKTLIYQTSKEHWYLLSDLYNEMLKIEQGE